jgi:omega-6 fatty acid desaturase (delta-12 desaturase)
MLDRAHVQVFVPKVRSEPDEKESALWESPVYRLAHMTFMFTLGWPMYLLFNLSGHEYPRWANHFDPYSPIFSKRERLEVLISDAALLGVVGGLYKLGIAMGWSWLVKIYVIPYMIVNFWLVMITFLQVGNRSA